MAKSNHATSPVPCFFFCVSGSPKPGRIGLINMVKSMKSSGKVADMSSRRVTEIAGEQLKGSRKSRQNR